MTTQTINPFAEFLAENGPKTVTPLRSRHQSDRELFAVLRSQVENLIPTVNRMVSACSGEGTDALVDEVEG